MKIFIAGHNGMVGSALIRALKNHKKYSSIITKSRKELDLINQTDVEEFLDNEKPDTVIIAAAKVGGIYANNSFPADFIYQNLMIQNNLIHGSYLAGIKKLLFLGSSCIYPKMSLQPSLDAFTPPLIPEWIEFTNVLYPELQAAILGDKTPAQALETASKKATEIMEDAGYF